MTRHPNLWMLGGLYQHLREANVQAEVNGQLVPARPLGYPSVWHRVKCAWLVFTGQADAVLWPGQTT